MEQAYKKFLRMFRRRGQTFVEYTLMIGIAIAVMLAVAPMIKRGTQGMVKVVADELGVQQNAENIGAQSAQTVAEALQNKGGGLISSDVTTDISKNVRHQEWRAGTTHSVQKSYADTVTTTTDSKSDLGFREED